MNKLVKFVLVGAMMMGVASLLFPGSEAHAVNVFEPCTSGADSSVCKSQNDDAASMIKTVINTLLYVLGAVAVLMIIIGGIRYTTSGGDASSLKAAKDTILYSVVGLVVAMMALAIVNFVIGRF